MLKGATQLVINTPNFISGGGSDESTTVARIGQHLRSRSAGDYALFQALHEQMSAYVSNGERGLVNYWMRL